MVCHIVSQSRHYFVAAWQPAGCRAVHPSLKGVLFCSPERAVSQLGTACFALQDGSGGVGFVKSFPGRCENLCLAGQAYKHTYMVRLSALGGRQAVCVFCGCLLCVSLSANLLCHVCSSWFFQSSSPASAQRRQHNSCIHIVCQCKYSMKRHPKVLFQLVLAP